MVKSILSVIAGFLTMAIVVMLGTFAAAAALLPGGLASMRNSQGPPPTPTGTYLVANLVVSFIAALLGGWVAARLAPGSPRAHVIALAVVVVLMSFATAMTQKNAVSSQPGWYPASIAVIGVAGVLLGGLLLFRPVAAIP